MNGKKDLLTSLLDALAQIMDTIMGGLHPHGLMLDDASNFRRQIIVFQRFPVFGHSGIFAALAFRQDGVVISGGDRGL